MRIDTHLQRAARGAGAGAGRGHGAVQGDAVQRAGADGAAIAGQRLRRAEDGEHVVAKALADIDGGRGAVGIQHGAGLDDDLGIGALLVRGGQAAEAAEQDGAAGLCRAEGAAARVGKDRGHA